jgi:ubiquinone/menaquinone biosynthesis C-methylase UbiE
VNNVKTEKMDFDKVAASWDQQSARVKLAEDIAGAVLREVTLSPGMDLLDFGCGTGLLTLRLAPHVRSITGVDSSRGMLDVLEGKIAVQGPANVKIRLLDLDEGDLLSGSYDLVVSSMTLHHIRDVGPLLAQFREILKPSGCLCIADLDPDEGQFHESSQGIFHSGFDRAALRGLFEKAGFRDMRDLTATEVVKPAADGATRHFSVFLMTGRK